MKLGGKHAVVTGGASGIGRALCRRFAAEGARAVVVVDRDAAGARAVADEIGGLAVQTDVADAEQVQSLVESAERQYGPIDLFCSNAGINKLGGVELAREDWLAMFDVHVLAHVYAARAVLPSMLARGEGYLLHTASAAGLLNHTGSAPYAVTKHAVIALAEWLSISYGDRGIKVSVLCPQAVRTPMLSDPTDGGVAGVDGMLEPEQVAEAVVEGLAREGFLILPHPEVLEYMRRKTGDYDRWLAGMRRLSARFARD
jgi:NAD(P)-dependent dehydrogenase (short-subunit alcohol dehydrogenase family)